MCVCICSLIVLDLTQTARQVTVDSCTSGVGVIVAQQVSLAAGGARTLNLPIFVAHEAGQAYGCIGVCGPFAICISPCAPGTGVCAGVRGRDVDPRARATVTILDSLSRPSDRAFANFTTTSLGHVDPGVPTTAAGGSARHEDNPAPSCSALCPSL